MRQVHSIDEYLSESWVDQWVGDVVREIEAYLAKHAAFADYTDGNPSTP